MAGLLKASQHALAKVLLETGSSLEWLGKTIVADYSFYDHISQHRTFVGVPSLGNPVVDSTSTIDESATIVGNVEIGPKVTVASNAIISGPTTIGESAEIGAGAVLKVRRSFEFVRGNFLRRLASPSNLGRLLLLVLSCSREPLFPQGKYGRAFPPPFSPRSKILHNNSMRMISTTLRT